MKKAILLGMIIACLLLTSIGFADEEFITNCKDLNETGRTYDLMNDINNASGICFAIHAAGATLDCSGHTINGGSILVNNNSITIFNCKIENSGFYINPLNNNTSFIMNTVTNCGYGFGGYGNYNSFINNTVTNCSEGFLISGDYNSFINNTVTNSSYVFGFEIYGNNLSIINNTASHSPSFGFHIGYGSNISFISNTANYSWVGFNLTYISDSIISGNRAYNNSFCDLFSSTLLKGNNVIVNNTLFNSDNGVMFGWMNDSTIENNIIYNNSHGISGWLIYSTIKNNMIYNNNYGISSYGNINYNIIYNNFFNNTVNIDRFNGNNSWNTTKTLGTNIVGGPYIGGNYWSDYNGIDSNGDSIGDTNLPYNSSNNITNDGDYLPLIPKPSICNCTDLTERIEKLESQIQILNSTLQSNTQRIELLEFIVNSLQNAVKTIMEYLFGSETNINLTSCSILNQTGATYYLKNDIINSTTCMNIAANNITLDCEGHTLNGMESVTKDCPGPSCSSYGIRSVDASNTIIKNCIINNFTYGIYLNNSSNNMLINNTDFSSYFPSYGIYLESSLNNILTNNTVNSNYAGIYLYSSSNNTLNNNTAYFDGHYYGIYLVSSSSNNIYNNIANSNYEGIRLVSSSSNNIYNNILNSNSDGIYLDGSFNTLTNNTANSNTFYGIDLEDSFNTLIGNIANSNSVGIFLHYASYNNLTNNTANANNLGIWLFSISNNNTLKGNTANSNTLYGIDLDGSSYNNIQLSNTSNNRVGIYEDGGSFSNIDMNYICKNTGLDLNSSDWSFSSGNNNTCDKPDGWNDTGFAGCKYACTLCTAESCDLQDGCYAYQTGCEDRNYFCQVTGCNYTFSSRNTDTYDNFVNYCSANTIRTHRTFHDFSCSGICSDHTSFVNDSLVQECSSQNGWYNTSITQWVNATPTTEKEQIKQESRDYTCSNANCTYFVNNTRWTDTGATRNITIQKYCSVKTSNANYEWITRVSLNGNQTTSGSSTYSDFTGSLLTTLSKGANYTLYVDVNTTWNYNEFVKAWIDFNDNGNFSADEEINLGSATFNGIHTFSKNFTVPINATSGETRMRVYLRYGSAPTPCVNASSGEIEDYMLSI